MDPTNARSVDAGPPVGPRFDASKFRQFAHVGLFVLIACIFCLDVFHGIRLGEDRIGFQPIYRLRQSLAVAVSRLHNPPIGHYLAYGSVIDALTENGFAVFDNEPGPHLDKAEVTALLGDGARIDHAILAALAVSIDPTQPTDIVKANELGYADYIYFSFVLFGAKLSSLYYLFFSVTLIACLLFIAQFGKSSLSLFLLVILLAELYFLENYARSHGLPLNTISNSRLFSGLSLLPAMHVLLLLWRRQPFNWGAGVGVFLQGLVFAFLLSTRTEIAWQTAMIAFAAGVSLLGRSGTSWNDRLRRLGAPWPAALFLAVVTVYSAAIPLRADESYAHERKDHILWHEVAWGILHSNEQIRSEYLGDSPAIGDERVYAAVIYDINRRNHTSSPIVHRLPDGQLTLDLMSGWGDYDRLVKSLVLRIVYRHPFLILAELPVKIGLQVMFYDLSTPHSMSWGNFRVPILIVVFGALLCIAAGGLPVDQHRTRTALGPIAIVLFFSLATPLIHPSPLAIGTLFAYLGVVALALGYAASGAVHALRHRWWQRPTAEPCAGGTTHVPDT